MNMSASVSPLMDRSLPCLKTELKISLSRIHSMGEACFFINCIADLFVEGFHSSLCLFLKNAFLIVFDFFQIMPFRLPLGFQTSPFSQQSSLLLSHGSVSSFLFHSLPLNAHSIDAFSSILAPVMLFFLLAFPFVSHLLFVKGSLQCFLPRYTLCLVHTYTSSLRSF